MIRHAPVAAVLVLLVAACSGSSAGASAQPGSAEPVAAPTPTAARPSYALSLPPFASAPATNAPVTGEAPAALVDAAKADLAKRTGLDPAAFVVLRDEQVIWSDGSLGCPVQGYLYTQVVTPGYWIQLETGAKAYDLYDYRSTLAGPVRLCENPSPTPPSG